ncbi:MAG: WYL domain-containing protein [Nocardioidaceae bacterium]|nr:WYL domain-containing protein [Nocardioidaceae bacterium]
MPAPKSERLLNLLIMLLVQRRPISKDRIRTLLYADSRPDAFEKMFERDKDELRGLGVPVDVASTDPFFDDEIGYRIPPDAFALPDIQLDAEEAAVVGLASRVWQHATMAQASGDAIRKLSAAGFEVDLEALDIAQPMLNVEEPAFDRCWLAVCERFEVRFDYQRPGATQSTTRRLQPWGVVRSSGRWYVVGFDLDRHAERVFRLSRITGQVETVGGPGSYEIPAETDVRDIAQRLAPPSAKEPAVLLIRSNAAQRLRRMATEVDDDVPGPDTHTIWDRVKIERPSLDLADDVLAHGTDVVVLEPNTVRQQVIDRIDQAIA